MAKKFRIEYLLITVFSYLSTAFVGWQILSFANIFFQLNQNRIQFSFSQWMQIQLLYLPIISGAIIIICFFVINQKSFKHKQFPINYKTFRLQIIFLFILIAGALLNLILYTNQISQNFIELINLVLALISLHQLSKVFYIKNQSSWFHPTTISSFYISAILLGLSQLIIFKIITFSFSGYAYFLLIILIIELLRIFTRFKFLTKFSYETNNIARSLLGKYGIYFGVRIIAGIFMPVVYIIYALFVNHKLLQGVAALLIIGEFIERLLFIYLSDTTKKIQK